MDTWTDICVLVSRASYRDIAAGEHNQQTTDFIAAFLAKEKEDRDKRLLGRNQGCTFSRISQALLGKSS